MHVKEPQVSEFKVQSATKTAERILESTIQKVYWLIENNDYHSAINVANQNEYRDMRLRNAKGVCLLRLGRVSEAVNLFRSLALDVRTLMIKPNLPTEVVTNFATSLLLIGQLGGCVERLRELKDQYHPAVVRLLGAITKWKASLSLGKRIAWHLQLWEPIMELEFEPGDLCSRHESTQQ